MVRITLDLRKSVEENAQHYFEAAKKARRKAKGAEQAVATWKAKLAATPVAEKTAKIPKAVRKREWYEKFRWCISSDGFLMVGGRDASTNELLVKRHAQPRDVVFHTDMAGSPFIIVKTEGKEVPYSTLEEAAQFCASYGKGWKNGLSSLEVFHVAPEQVTKEANPGEFLPKGAFMIRGKTLYLKPLLKVAVGVDKDGRVMAGPLAAVKAWCPAAYEILQGNEKTSAVAKALQKLLGGDLDELLAALPAGGCQLGPKVNL
jgi:predicted ribosome quality control (RQC) complex YloA/Tae2 family protein